MTLILWIYRSSIIDIGEQKVYKNVVSVEYVNQPSGALWRIRYPLGDGIREDNWPDEQVIKAELI